MERAETGCACPFRVPVLSRPSTRAAWLPWASRAVGAMTLSIASWQARTLARRDPARGLPSPAAPGERVPRSGCALRRDLASDVPHHLRLQIGVGQRGPEPSGWCMLADRRPQEWRAELDGWDPVRSTTGDPCTAPPAVADHLHGRLEQPGCSSQRGRHGRPTPRAEDVSIPAGLTATRPVLGPLRRRAKARRALVSLHGCGSAGTEPARIERKMRKHLRRGVPPGRCELVEAGAVANPRVLRRDSSS